MSPADAGRSGEQPRAAAVTPSSPGARGPAPRQTDARFDRPPGPLDWDRVADLGCSACLIRRSRSRSSNPSAREGYTSASVLNQRHAAGAGRGTG